MFDDLTICSFHAGSYRYSLDKSTNEDRDLILCTARQGRESKIRQPRRRCFRPSRPIVYPLGLQQGLERRPHRDYGIFIEYLAGEGPCGYLRPDRGELSWWIWSGAIRQWRCKECGGKLTIDSSSGSSLHIPATTGWYFPAIAYSNGMVKRLKTDIEGCGQAIQSSTRVYHHCGRVSLSAFPRLSEEAFHLLQTAKEPAKSFSANFGDYFVAGYVLGAGNVSMISGAGGSESRSENLNIDVEIHLAFISRQNNIHKESFLSTQAAAGTISVYDSLTDQHMEQSVSDIDKALAIWQENELRAERLHDRVATELSKMNLNANGSTIPHAACDELCRSGLVLELLMFPWTGLRNYTSAILTPGNASLD